MDFLQPIFPDYVWVVGLSMMAFGLVMMILLRTWASRRVFNRKNASGIQEFKSYGALVRVRLYEGSVGLFVTIIWLPIMFCGLALMVLWLGALFNTDSGELTFELFQEVVGDAIGFFRKFWD